VRIFTSLLAAWLFAALAACNTVGGVGQDIQSGGAALSDTAQDAEQSM
jgi:predicted small secreted protein